MEKNYSGEYFIINDINQFSEYKVFNAEEYYCLESATPPDESLNIKEWNNDVDTSNKEKVQRKFDDFNKQNIKINQSSSVSNSSFSTSAASHIAGTSASVSTIAATAVISVAVLGGVFSHSANYIKQYLGMDYVSINIDLDELIADNDISKNLNGDNFTIEIPFNNETKKINLKDGNNTYLITGLQPDTTYDYNLVCNDPYVGSSTTYYSDSIHTPKYSKPTGVYDEINSSLIVDNESYSALFNYSIYYSDYNHEYNNPTLYICSEEKTNFMNMQNVLYSTNSLDENNFFKGIINEIKTKQLYIYITGDSNINGDNLDNSEIETQTIFSFQLDVPIPDEWTETDPLFEIDKELETIETKPNKILINGGISKFNASYTYNSYIIQYDLDGNSIEDVIESPININEELMTYSIEFDAYYGVKEYQYIICTEENGNILNVYQSDRKAFLSKQEFLATYDKVSPKNADINYDNESIIINVNPNFKSDFEDVYHYKLLVKNSFGVIFGEYEGTGNANIVITDYKKLDTINFEYIDCASFINADIEYSNYYSDSIEFCYPTFSLYNDIGYNGEFFTISYHCNMIYEYELASIDLIVNDGINEYLKHVDNVYNNGTIILDNIFEELNEVSIIGKLHFKDNQENGEMKTIQTVPMNSSLSYKFAVESVNVNLSSLEENVPVTLKFDTSFIPSTYKIKISDSSGYINQTIDMTDEYYFNTNVSSLNTVLSIQILDENLVEWNDKYEYTISSSDANNNFSEPSYTPVYPVDSVVTYNDDGTINIYRDVNFTTSDENIYLNAFIYNQSTYNATENRTIYSGCYDIICRNNDKYAVIENIPKMMYKFVYYTLFEYNNICYTMFSDISEKTLEFYENFASASITKNRENELDTQIITSTTVNVILEMNVTLENKVFINGVEYQYDASEDGNGTSVKLQGDIEVNEIIIFYAIYNLGYLDFCNDLVMKGNLYDQYNIGTIIK